jgi:hypothetical protein
MQSHRQPNENLGRGVQQAMPTPEFEITCQSAVLAMRANFDQTRRARVPRTSVGERLMEEAAMEKMLLLVVMLSVLIITSTFGQTTPTVRP